MEQWLERISIKVNDAIKEVNKPHISELTAIVIELHTANELKIEELRILRKIHNIPEDF